MNTTTTGQARKNIIQPNRHSRKPDRTSKDSVRSAHPKGRAPGARLADRLGERREEAYTDWLEEAQACGYLGVERPVRAMLRWATHQGSIRGLHTVEVNPYALGPQLGYSPVYLRDVLTLVSRYVGGIDPGTQGSRGTGKASTFFLPVLGPSLADLQAEAQVAKVAAKAKATGKYRHYPGADDIARNADFLPLPPLGSFGSTEEESIDHQRIITKPGASESTKEEFFDHQHSITKQGRSRQGAALAAVPARWAGVYGDLQVLVEGMSAPDRFSEAALRSVLEQSQVDPAEGVELLRAAAQDASSRPGTRSIRAYALAVLRPGSKLAQTLRERILRRTVQQQEVPTQSAVRIDAEAVETLIAAEVSPSQADRIVTEIAAAAPDLQPRYLVAAAIETLGSRRGVNNRGGYLRSILTRRDAVLLKRARTRQKEDLTASSSPWDKSLSPRLQSVPGARKAFDEWQRLRASAPSPESAGYLAHHDQEREARAALLAKAEAALGPDAETLQQELRQRLEAADMKEGSLVWKRAWNHHWAESVATAYSLDLGN